MLTTLKYSVVSSVRVMVSWDNNPGINSVFSLISYVPSCSIPVKFSTIRILEKPSEETVTEAKHVLARRKKLKTISIFIEYRNVLFLNINILKSYKFTVHNSIFLQKYNIFFL